MRSGIAGLLLLSLFQPLLLATSEGVEAPPAGPSTVPQAADESSRAQEWRQLRLQKAQSTAPPQISGFEKALLYLERGSYREVPALRFKDFYPKLGNIAPGSGFSPGLRYFRSNLGRSKLSVEATGAFSFIGYKLASVEFGKFTQVAPYTLLGPAEFATPFKFGEKRDQVSDFFLYGDVCYRYFPREQFYGLGPDSRQEDRTDFLLEDGTFDVVAGYHYNRLGVAARLGFLGTNTAPGSDDDFPDTQDRFDDTSVPGLGEQPDFIRLNSAIYLDYRDNPGNPHKGGLLGFSFARFDARRNAKFDFNRLSFDARGYLPLASRQRVLALRLFASRDNADSGNEVPFYLMRTLGGNQMLRAFREFRFRDSRLLYVSAEYRWEAWPALEFAIFYDAGKVFPRGEDFNFKGLRNSVGGGIRFKAAGRTLFRLDVGDGSEGTRVHFQLGPSF